MPSLATPLSQAAERDSARPRVTWYDDATGERVELSAATLSTWMAKTVHLLTDELGAGAGVAVAIDLPRHWLRLLWWLAVDAVGAHPFDPNGADRDPRGGDPSRIAPAVAVVGPGGWEAPIAAGADEVVAVSLLPLAAPFTEPLPALVSDFSVVVRSHPDRVTLPAVDSPLGAAARTLAASWQLLPTDRLLVGVPGDAADAAADAIAFSAALSGDASLVLVGNPRTPLDVERLVTEQVTCWTAQGTCAEPVALAGCRMVSFGR
jgi:uncharacterized protein (TIGR03089 family)